MRSGEVTVPADNAFDPGTHITFEDLSMDNTANPQFVKLWLKSSKTDPFRRGVDPTIQMLGRWSSSAYRVYIKTPREQLANFSAVLDQHSNL